MDDCLTLEDKFRKIKTGSFDGVELEVPLNAETCRRARQTLDDLGQAVIAQQWNCFMRDWLKQNL